LGAAPQGSSRAADGKGLDLADAHKRYGAGDGGYLGGESVVGAVDELQQPRRKAGVFGDHGRDLVSGKVTAVQHVLQLQHNSGERREAHFKLHYVKRVNRGDFGSFVAACRRHCVLVFQAPLQDKRIDRLHHGVAPFRKTESMVEECSVLCSGL
jgi:hypothetical protein